MSARILVVEDERDLLDTLDYNLRREGYETHLVSTGRDALAVVGEPPTPDLVLLDVMLPDITGTEVCRRIREQEATRATPVVMLTARGEESDRISGLEVGADDYVVKPFSVRELLLRIRAVLRRSESEPEEPGSLAFGCLRVDPAAHRVWVDDSLVSLTALEFNLVTMFLRRAGRVQSRHSLLADVWGIEADVATRTVDTHVKRLREKLGRAGQYIETVRGVGYRFRADPDEES